MRLRNKYRLAGVAWALLLAPLVTYVVLGFVLGVMWLYVFGDNPWPAWLDRATLVVASLVFISTATCCIYLANRYGHKREAESNFNDLRERRRVLLLGLAPIVLIAIDIALLWQRSMHQAEATVAMEDRQAAFTEMLSVRHVIVELDVNRTDDGDFEVRITTTGGKAGPYSLFWQVNSEPYGEILSDEDQNIEIGHETGVLSFEISMDKLANSYRDTILNGGGVVVDEPFELVVMLQPAVDEDDFEAWPESERYRWEQGETPLASRMTINFPVFFRVGKNGTIDHSTP